MPVDIESLLGVGKNAQKKRVVWRATTIMTAGNDDWYSSREIYKKTATMPGYNFLTGMQVSYFLGWFAKAGALEQRQYPPSAPYEYRIKNSSGEEE